MIETKISCQTTDPSTASGAALFDVVNEETIRHVYHFHRSLPGYRPSPLVRLPALAGYLGIRALSVKDENLRFDLKAFKVLGASYAMAKCLGEVIGLGDDELTYPNIIARKPGYEHLTFVTATDGNHGRAVAWAAKQFGCSAVVYLPKGSSSVRLEAIRKYGARASLTRLARGKGAAAPFFVVVEPEGAPCLFESIKKGERIRVEGDLATIMAGLSCGEPSLIGWEILKSGARAFLMCSDEVARRGMKVLGNPLAADPCIVSGESGAVTLGALFEIMMDKNNGKTGKDLGLNSDSRVLLFSTEGDTDPDVYRDIVWA